MPIGKKPTEDFERFVGTCVDRSGWKPAIKVKPTGGLQDPFFYIKSGTSREGRLIFVFFPTDTNQLTLQFEKGFLTVHSGVDIISGKQLIVNQTEAGGEVDLCCPAWRFAVLLFQQE